MTEKKISKLPSLQQLAQAAWELFQKTAISYLKLFGLTLASLFVGVLIGISISLPISLAFFGSNLHNFNHLANFPVFGAILIVLWFILYLVLIIAIGIVFPIVSIFILQMKGSSSLFDLIKQSKRYVIPYLLTSLLSAFITFGGVILFFIPALLIGVFFIFMPYEVILEKQSGRQALVRSYVMVKNHFLEIVLRLFVFEIGYLIISSVFNHLAGESFLLRFIQFLFIVFSMWYFRSYLYVLYTQIRERTTFPQHISLRWIWIVSGIGWLLTILILIAVGFGISHFHSMMHPVRPVHNHRLPPGTV